MDCSLPGSSVHGISQTRIWEWVAISFSRGSSLQRSNPSLLLGRQILSQESLPLSHLGNPTLQMLTIKSNFSRITYVTRASLIYGTRKVNTLQPYIYMLNSIRLAINMHKILCLRKIEIDKTDLKA